MKRAFVIFVLIGLSWPVSAQPSYKPARVVSARDAYVPFQVMIDGFFVFDVLVNNDGTVERIDALRNPGAMPGAAKTSISSWKFQPASQAEEPAPSRMTVSFVYRPPNYGNAAAVAPKAFAPVLPPDQPETSEHRNYTPVGILSFAYPAYPVNSVAWGSVVVQVTVDDSGDVKAVEFLHGMAGFNNLVSDALKAWHFQAATFNGKPIKSKAVVAFIFQPPAAQ
jgi:TonB family protein